MMSRGLGLIDLELTLDKVFDVECTCQWIQYVSQWLTVNLEKFFFRLPVISHWKRDTVLEVLIFDNGVRYAFNVWEKSRELGVDLSFQKVTYLGSR